MCAQLSRLVIFAFISIIIASPKIAQAKELTNRLGMGYSDQFSEPLPSMSVRYWPDPKLGVGAALGVDTQDDNSRFGFMVRLYRIIFTEDNMNFYMGTGAGLISVETTNAAGTATDNNSGFELNGFFGTEFFLAGLDSLGICFEAGVGVTSISSEVRFRTMGDSPIRAGMTFYF
jgi:hypothetical protein